MAFVLLIGSSWMFGNWKHLVSNKFDISQRIIDQSILVCGLNNAARAKIEFDFRDKHYTFFRKKGQYKYERSFQDTSGMVHDILTNEGLVREINGKPVELTEERRKAYSNSVNSVIYFSLLPYFLNDVAVIKQYIGKVDIKGESYHKIRVNFKKKGGGDDHQDQYIFWFHEKRLTMDFLAYSYQEDGGGARFRKAYQTTKINGMRFADYVNYKPIQESDELELFDEWYAQDRLVELSKIDLLNIKVELQ
jgi:uncharacterized protein YajQ (UPF0234 family)